VTAGGSVAYTITVSNVGPSDATGVTVTDTFPESPLNPSWTSVAAGGASGNTAGDPGDIFDSGINLPVNGSVTYTVTATLDPSATGTLSNTATVTAPGDVTDPNTANNSATDSDTIGAAATTTTSTTTTTTTTEPAATPTTSVVTTSTTTTEPTPATDTPTTSVVPTSTTTTTTPPGRLETVTALTASPNPSTLGQPVTFTATVTLVEAGGPVGFRSRAPQQLPGPDGGTLTISEGDIVLAVVPIAAGRAVFTTSSLMAGAHPITAAFSGTATAAPSSATVV
jgi:uncharacterized repeat protein (TIGR01451 family)